MTWKIPGGAGSGTDADEARAFTYLNKIVGFFDNSSKTLGLSSLVDMYSPSGTAYTGAANNSVRAPHPSFTYREVMKGVQGRCHTALESESCRRSLRVRRHQLSYLHRPSPMCHPSEPYHQ
jgi:hypothetical protein